MTTAAGDAGGAPLATRLRELRERQWPGRRITQLQLAEAFGGGRPLSISLISSWESVAKPVTPPPFRLQQYSIFFATQRSLEGPSARLLDLSEMTDEEQAEYHRLSAELSNLRERGDSGESTAASLPLSGPGGVIGGGPFHFPDRRPVTIVCAELPAELRSEMPYTDPTDPDYVRSYIYADLDSLIELHGHLRAVNPTVQVNIRTPRQLTADDFATHLVLLGGVDWNAITRHVLRQVEFPVRPALRLANDPYAGSFEVALGSAVGTRFVPVLEHLEGKPTLIEDVAHVFRIANPYNRKRTLTLCNGVFGQGTYGAVRALTDAQFRDRNADYLLARFGGFSYFSVLARVVLSYNGEAVTPDWTVDENRLHEWPAPEGDA